MRLFEMLVNPLRPTAATFLTPSSNCSIWSLGAALLIAVAWLAYRRKQRRRRLSASLIVCAVFSRRVLLHRSTRADLAYCALSLMFLGAVIGWAVVSTSWIGDCVANFLANHLGERTPQAARRRARRGAHARALPRLRPRLLRRPHAQASDSGAVGIAQDPPFGGSPDPAGQLPRPSARFADPRQHALAVHRRRGGRGDLRSGPAGDVVPHVRRQRADGPLHLSDGATAAHADLDPVHRRLGARLHEPRPPPAAPFRRPGPLQLQHGREPRAVGLARGQPAPAVRAIAAAQVRRFGLRSRPARRVRPRRRAGGEVPCGSGVVAYSAGTAASFAGRAFGRGAGFGRSGAGSSSDWPNRRLNRRQESRPTSSSTVNAAGTKTSDKSVDMMRPPVTAIAIGERKPPPAPRPSAEGIMPKQAESGARAGRRAAEEWAKASNPVCTRARRRPSSSTKSGRRSISPACRRNAGRGTCVRRR